MPDENVIANSPLRFFDAPRSPDDITVRPKYLDEFTGQEKLKDKLKIYISAAKGRASLWITFCSTDLRGLARRRWPGS